MNIAAPLPADPVEAQREPEPLWQPARLMRGDTLLADVEWDADEELWIATIYTGNSFNPRLYETFDTFAEAVVWADKWLKKRGML